MPKIVLKDHQNAMRNPLAHMRREVAFELCNAVSDKKPLIAAPCASPTAH
jgi:acetyl-CoA C-acetyltransferase